MNRRTQQKKKLQKWFNKNYSQDGKKETKGIDILNKHWKAFDGHLEIEGYNSLENIKLDNFKSANLRVSNCPKLIKIELLKFHSNLIIIDCPELAEVKFSDCSIENLFVGDCPKLIDLNCDHSKLDNLDLSSQNLLDKLFCSKNNLTELSVRNLTELICPNNSIEYLNLNLCPEITKLDCSSNRLAYLEIRNCSKLDFLNCSKNKPLTSLNISNCLGLENKVIKDPNLKLVKDENKIAKNILIVGRTGGGKSTLSNVLCDSSEFKESGGSVSKTKNFQNKIFERNGIRYRVVDTMGVGDTVLSKQKVLYKIAEGIYSMPEGISHVLFVVDGRFTAEEIDTFLTFEKAIFESGIVEYITIVRTKFSNFKNYWECEKDRQKLADESKKISKMVEDSNGILYVDNPVVDIAVTDDNDRDTVEINKRIRGASRTKLLDYLEIKCQEECLKKCHPSKCQTELGEHRKKCTREHQEVLWKEELEKRRNKFPKELLEVPKDAQELSKERKEFREKMNKKLEQLPEKLQKEHREKCQLEEHQKKCQRICQRKCYYNLKKWDQLRDEIAVHMKEINYDSENLDQIMEEIAKITERRLKSELPSFIRAFTKVKDDCTIV